MTRAYFNFLRLSLLMVAGMIGFASVTTAQDTNNTGTNAASADAQAAEAAVITAQQVLRSNLAIQDELRELLGAAERSRKEAETAMLAVDLLGAQLNEMKAAMHTRQIEALTAQKSTQTALTAVVAFATFALLVLLLAAFVQWNTINRITAATAMMRGNQQTGRAPLELGPGETPMLPGGAVEASSSRFLSIVERIEQRLHDMEIQPHHANGGAPANGESRPDTEVAALPAGASDRLKTISVLMNKGQTLLKLDQPADALACFDEVLALDPGHTDGLLKKGAALERLQRLDEAVDCYDHAIAVDSSSTMAYLHKGGVFNRMERYSEALECYEQALKVQEKDRNAEAVIAG